jgi:hypothetical protein
MPMVRMINRYSIKIGLNRYLPARKRQVIQLSISEPQTIVFNNNIVNLSAPTEGRNK